MKPLDEDFNDPKTVKAFNELLNSPDWLVTQETIKAAKSEYESECDEYWESLPYDDRLKAFYSVVKRIYKGEIKDKGSYRWVLYDVFGFGPEAYSMGMDCGFMYLHNAIVEAEEE